MYKVVHLSDKMNRGQQDASEPAFARLLPFWQRIPLGLQLSVPKAWEALELPGVHAISRIISREP